MAQYKIIFNPFTGKFQYVPANLTLAFKPAVSTQSSLPSLGNNIGDARLTEDTGHLWVWSGTAWIDEGAFATIDWSAIIGKPTSSPSQIDTAVTEAGNAVPQTRTVNGHALSSDVTVSASDIPATGSGNTVQSDIDEIETDLTEKVDKTTTVNGHPLSSNVTVTNSDVGLGNVTNDAQLKASQLTTDGTLSANSDAEVPSEKAVKTYIDTGLATKSNLAPSPTAGDIATVDGSGNVTDSGKVFDTDGTLSANSDNHIATQKAIKTYSDQLLAAAHALTYKGALDLSTNPNYPAGAVGDVYTVSVAGKIGGASGVSLTQGDLVVCRITNAGGDQTTVGADWDTVQVALNNIVIGPTGALDSDIALFDGTTGVLIKDSGKSITTDGTLAANSDSLIPTEKAVKTYADTKVSSSSVSDSGVSITTDGTLSANSDTLVPTEKAVKTYADTKVPQTTTVNGHALSSNVTVTSSDVGLGNVTNDAQIKASDFPGSSTDGDIALFNGTGGKSLKDSGKTLPSGTVIGTTDTQTLTNKRITRRVNTVASSATPSINTDTTDLFTITALATAITSMTTNLTGTPVNGDLLEVRILDNGSPQSITWGTSFASTGGTTLPTTTVASTTLRVLLEWNSASSLWECIGTT